MSDRWIANKFGLFDFWYYDEEEFELSNGKIIFRGTNGSGKSVTTQSFIPLLLDILFKLFGIYDLSTCGIGS